MSHPARVRAPEVAYPPVNKTEPCFTTGNPELFFPVGVGKNRNAAAAAPAKALCNGDEEHPRCHVRDQCLAYALANDVTGVWGGTTADERADTRRRLHLRPHPVVSTVIDRVQVLRMWHRGTSYEAIARALGINPEVVARVIREQRTAKETA